MEATDNDATERVSIMTLHGAKGLEFDTVFLPGWEEGLFPNQRALDESGKAGLEEERRLAYVGITRARRRAKIYFASNRRIHGMWQSTIPSRFVDELPEAHVEVTEAPAQYGGYRRQPLRPDGALRLDLRHPRLAARAGAHAAGRRSGGSGPGGAMAQTGGRGGRDGSGGNGGGSTNAMAALQRLRPQRAAADRGRTRRQVHRRQSRLRRRASASSTSSSATARSPAWTATS